MAFAADLSSLTDALISSVTKISPSQKGSARFQSLKRRIQGGLRTGSHTRTDQFAVAKQLEGLQEKFQVLNRDELTEALSSRLVELEDSRNSWLPEILSLLLQLSDRPALLSTVDRLKTTNKSTVTPDSLSWSDLNPEGAAYSDEEIWEQVDFTAGSSDEDDFSSIVSDVSAPRHRPSSSTAVEEDYIVPNGIFTSAQDEDLIVAIEKAQFWKPEIYPPVTQGEENAFHTITELQLARETIFMLQGLPTSVFWHSDENIEVDRRYALGHSSSESLASLLQRFGEIGTKVYAVRDFIKTPQTIPYLQTFCRGVEELLHEFDKIISQVQCKYLSAGQTISLLQLLADVRSHSHELVLLAEMIAKLGESSTAQPMRCLDLLYNLICMLEAVGDESASQRLAKLFFLCFKTYTRSIQLWMETGQVDPSDITFFVRANREGDLRTLWHDWFVLDEGPRRQKIPQFLETSVQKIFTAGKSMVFLHHLNALVTETHEKSDMTLDAISSSESSILLPFSALVESAFEKLVDVDHSLSSIRLREELDEKCGLWSSLDALQHVYLGKDMSVLGMIDSRIFEMIDHGRSWDDRFLLTEISRTAFSSIPIIDTSRLLVRPTVTTSHESQNQRSVTILESISIDYGLPWPVANIITEESISSYRQISTFLIQIRRARYSMVKQRIREARKMPGEKDDTLVHALHHNMLWFIDFIYGHLTYLVISTATQSLHSALLETKDVDSMIAAHQSYMSSLKAQCLLSENLSPIHKAIISLLDLCVHFADLQTAHLSGAPNSEEQDDEENSMEAVNILIKKDPKNDFDSDDSDDDMGHEHTLTVSFHDSSYNQQMKNVKIQFNHLVTFVADGLKRVARADGFPSWDILAERLEWCKR
ncbi:uncharacterized protein N7511_000609 [Penicillium nucicola]|uniref:uncharacterized protein n=1 Tax=Penicillium nucicola TaxID=1850975 RepID=UPI0025454E67|nr:uncharacterized protein N7511_000609 [Penicillium nucicola]KAJ5775598.1 hypothetical protein N7511_000609 [Penicillium nucicola]